MEKLSSKHKDLFDVAKHNLYAKDKGHSIVIPHVCSNANRYSSFFSQKIARLYPDVEINYQLLGSNFLAKSPGYVQFNDVEREPEYNRRLIVASMIAQNEITNKPPNRTLNYVYLVKSMISIKSFMIKNFNSENKAIIYLDKRTFKSAGGNWAFIQNLIKDVWYDLDVEIF